MIEKQTCVPPDSTGTGHDHSNAALMVANQTCLMKDLDRLNDLMSITKSMLATLNIAQDKAAEAKCDQQVLRYIDLCVRVTSRCYDGDASPRVEAQWTSIITACELPTPQVPRPKFCRSNSLLLPLHSVRFLIPSTVKKLLIGSLHFLHNLIQNNEHRKLLLWLDLFGSSKSSHPDLEFTGTGPLLANASVPPMAPPSTTADFKEEFTTTGVPIPSDEDLRIAMNRLAHGAGPSESLNRSEKVATLAHVRTTFSQRSLLTLAERNGSNEASLQPVDPSGTDGLSEGKWDWAKLELKDYSSEGIMESDTIVTKNPDAAAQTLREAKEQLMARLASRHAPDQETDPGDGSKYVVPDADGSDFATSGSGEEDGHVAADESGSMYPDLGDPDRGVLTDIPLVLGPDEMDALVLIIRGGITPCLNFPTDPKKAMELKHMQAVRCNILLAQDAGRNLLRELLIFIAAWEFDDETFYFRIMLQIMDAILNHGLIPFAYQTFGEVKDIVSPAQSIVIKLLTQLFRKKQNTFPPAGYKVLHGSPPVVPTRADLLVVRYIFTVFRQSIIPETCALIYLQGRIRQGAASPEDFPLTLWDMERVYEGVYQFLEFFAVLTENEMWKDMLVRWEIVSELVTLLRELDASIPKAPLTSAQTAREEAEAAGNARPTQGSTSASGQVERPYDLVSTDETAPAGYEADASAPESPSRDPENPDPADFEWRNLKKLVVLVLSSLVWKSVPVQDQIRQYGGVEMVLNCCNYDANNLYIREHAIMCLRFLLENSPENQEIVEKLEARKVVPSEVLDSKGYETFIDADGKVGLRPKDPSSVG